MTYDIAPDEKRKGFDRWHVVEFNDAQGRFLIKSEASARAGDLNDEYAGKVRDRIGARWRNVTRRNQ